MFTRSLDEIKETFQDYSDGVRVLLLCYRSKEGGSNHRIQRTELKKIVTTNSEEFFEAVKDLQATGFRYSSLPLRLYSSVNSRDLEKAIHKFKQTQLDNDYAEKEIKDSFYLDIKNRWISCLMQKSSRAQSNFLFDLDECDDRSFHSIYNEIEKLTKIHLYYTTKNGYHIITEPFNYNKLGRPEIDVHPDALLLLDY